MKGVTFLLLKNRDTLFHQPSQIKFLFFDLLGIVLWAFTFVSIGFYFGHSAIDVILFAQKNIFVVLFFIALFALILFSQNGDNR